MARVTPGIDSGIKIKVWLRRFRTGAAFNELDDGARMAAETSRLYFSRFTVDKTKLFGLYNLNCTLVESELKPIL